MTPKSKGRSADGKPLFHKNPLWHAQREAVFRHLFYDTSYRASELALAGPADKRRIFRELAHEKPIQGLTEEQIINCLSALQYASHFDTKTQLFAAYPPKPAPVSTLTDSISETQANSTVPALDVISTSVTAINSTNQSVQAPQRLKPALPFEYHDEICQTTQGVL